MFDLPLHLPQRAVYIRKTVEDRAGTHEVLSVDRRRPEQCRRFLHVADNASLSSEYDVVRHMDMSGQTNLSAKHTMLSYFYGTGDADLRRHHGILAYLHVMSDLYEIVQLNASANDRRIHHRTVNCRIGSDLYIILDNNVA